MSADAPRALPTDAAPGLSTIADEPSERTRQRRVRLARDPLALLNPDMPTARARKPALQSPRSPNSNPLRRFIYDDDDAD